MGIKCGIIYKIVELILAILGTVCYCLLTNHVSRSSYHDRDDHIYYRTFNQDPNSDRDRERDRDRDRDYRSDSHYGHIFYGFERSTHQAIAVCVVNAIITVTVLLVFLFKGKPSKVLELCLTGAVGLINLGVGTLLICTLGTGYRSALFFILAGICVGFGVVLIIDVLRIIKGIAD